MEALSYSLEISAHSAAGSQFPAPVIDECAALHEPPLDRTLLGMSGPSVPASLSWREAGNLFGKGPYVDFTVHVVSMAGTVDFHYSWTWYL